MGVLKILGGVLSLGTSLLKQLPSRVQRLRKKFSSNAMNYKELSNVFSMEAEKEKRKHKKKGRKKKSDKGKD